MRILITGATGFVGRNLVPMIVRKLPDAKMLILSRSAEKAKRLHQYENCIYANADNWEETKKFEPEIVIHLAAFSTSRNDDEIIDQLLSSNIAYGVHLLQALRKCKSLKLFINTGSFAEYRFGADHIEDAYLYTATKTAFRSFVDYYANLCNYSYINVIPYTIYGGVKTIKRLVDYILDSVGSKVPIDMTKGEQILDFTYVDDLCDFYVCCIEQLDHLCRLPQGETFHVGTGRGNTPRDVANIIEKLTGERCNINWGGRPYRERDTLQAVAPISKNLELLGWRAKTTLEKGLTMMIHNK